MGHNVKQVTKAKIHCPSYVRRFLITFYVVCTAFTFKLPEKGRNIFFLFQLIILQILLLLFLSSMASINFLRYLRFLKQISMTAQVIPVRTTEPVETE